MTPKLCQNCGHGKDYHGYYAEACWKKENGKLCKCKMFKAQSEICKTCRHTKKVHELDSNMKKAVIVDITKQSICKKFQPEDEITTNYDKSNVSYLSLDIPKIRKQKKGSSEEKVWKDYLNHVKKKQKKGCGKEVETDDATFFCGGKCDYCTESHLCPSCENQSPQGSKVGSATGAPAEFKDKPEDLAQKMAVESPGNQSPLRESNHGASTGDKPVDTINRNEAGTQSPHEQRSTVGRSPQQVYGDAHSPWVKTNSNKKCFFHKPEDTSTLSDKALIGKTRRELRGKILFQDKDVQEFIRRLKEELDKDLEIIAGAPRMLFHLKIDKLAGSKLL